MQPRRVALVTGSGQKRVGSVVAEALARRGYAIAVHYRTSAAEAEETAGALRAHGVEAANGALVKREGSPHNIAQAVLSFLDNDSVTGVCLPVDGGRTTYAPE
jgi:pteridine reductase